MPLSRGFSPKGDRKGIERGSKGDRKPLEAELFFADDFHFRFQLDAALLLGFFLNGLDEGEDVRGGGAAVVDDEVCVDV